MRRLARSRLGLESRWALGQSTWGGYSLFFFCEEERKTAPSTSSDSNNPFYSKNSNSNCRLEDSDEEQGLQSDILNLVTNPQLVNNSTEQSRAEQTSTVESSTTVPLIVEPSRAKITTTTELAATTVEPTAVESTIVEQTTSHRAEQTISAEPPQATKQAAAAQTTPPPPLSEDKGYGHGVTLDSMIVTPHFLHWVKSQSM